MICKTRSRGPWSYEGVVNKSRGPWIVALFAVLCSAFSVESLAEVISVTGLSQFGQITSATLNGPTGYSMSGSDIFVADYSSGLKRIKISDLSIAETFPTGSNQAKDVIVDGTDVYIASKTASSYCRIDKINALASPTNLYNPASNCSIGDPIKMAVTPDKIILGGMSGLSVIDKNPLTEIRAYGSLGQVKALAVHSSATYAIVAQGSIGIKVIDYSFPTLSVRGTWSSAITGASANDVAIVGDKVFVANGMAGLAVLTINPDGTLSLVRETPLFVNLSQAMGMSIDVIGNLVYLTTISSGYYPPYSLTVVDLSNNMQMVAQNVLTDQPTRVKLFDSKASVLTPYGSGSKISMFYGFNTIHGSVTAYERPLSNVTVQLSDGANIIRTYITGSDGTFTFGNVPGSKLYSITAYKVGYDFSTVTIPQLETDSEVTLTAFPQSYQVTINTHVDSNTLSGVNFGNITSNEVVPGTYQLTLLYGQNYSIVPTFPGYVFTPSSYLVSYPPTQALTYQATPQTFMLSGKVAISGASLAQVTLNLLIGNSRSPVVVNTDGSFGARVPFGVAFQLVPTLNGFSFDPPMFQGVMPARDVTKNFTATILDSDGDGVSDLQEAVDKTDPNDSGSFVQVLGNNFCSEWNGFLGMMNVAENSNFSPISTGKLDGSSRLYDFYGKVASEQSFSIPPSYQLDRVVSKMTGFKANSIGGFCTTLSSGPIADFDGRMVYYKPDDTGGFKFAFALPYSSGIKGRQYVHFSSTQATGISGQRANMVGNSIVIVNLEDTAQKGRVNFYNSAGKLVIYRNVLIKEKGRIDVSGNFSGVSYGLVEWIPRNGTSRFQIQNIRQYYDNSLAKSSYNTIYPFTAAKGSGQWLTLPVDAQGSNVRFDISNTTNVATPVFMTIYGKDGSVILKPLKKSLPPHSTWTAKNIEEYFSNLTDKFGVAKIRGGTPGSIIATMTRLSRYEDGTLKNVYAINATEAHGVVLQGSFNTFLGQGCKLLLLNSTSSNVPADMNMRNNAGSYILKGEPLTVPANGALEYDLCAKAPPDSVGVFFVAPKLPHSISATLIRIGAGDKYRFPTPLRE